MTDTTAVTAPEITAIPEPTITVGSRVLINKGLVAEIVSYSPEANNVVYVVREGNSANYTTSHISNTDIELLDTGTHAVVADDDELDAVVAAVNFTSAPVEEAADTERVK